MQFTREELVKIASWTPVAAGFDRDDATIATHIRPILKRLSSDRHLAIRVMQEGGLSNYFSFLLCEAIAQRPPGGEALDIPCVVVKLSLMAPVGIFGHSTFSEGEQWFGHPRLEPEQVCDPSAPRDWVTAAAVAAVHETSPYRLVGRDVTDQPLPPGVEVYEYCFCAEPWNRVYHALFADTD